MSLRLTLVSNGIQLEAARRLRLRESGAGARPVVDLLLVEARRLALTPEHRTLWPLRLPVNPLVMACLVPFALAGAVGELRLAHLRGAGRALGMIAARARRLVLLDDGLDQYRDHPRAIDPEAFPAGTPCWLFSDAASFRASWCRRFACHDLGPLYPAPAAAAKAGDEPGEAGAFATLVIDAPGLERLREGGAALPRPLLLVPHPVRSKRSWSGSWGRGDALAPAGCSPEALLASFRGLVVVGESMTLLAALRLRPPGSRLLVALPATADPNLQRLVRQEARRHPAMEVLGSSPEPQAWPQV